VKFSIKKGFHKEFSQKSRRLTGVASEKLFSEGPELLGRARQILS